MLCASQLYSFLFIKKLSQEAQTFLSLILFVPLILFWSDKLIAFAVYVDDLYLIVSLQADIRDTEKKIDRLIDQIEDGTASARVNERLQQRENELDSLKKQLHAERTKQEPVDPFAARLFLTGVRDASILDETFDKLLVNSLIDRIYLYDDHFRLLLKNSNKKSKTTKREAAEIERYFDNKGSDSALGAPPQTSEQSEVFLLSGR